MIYLLTGNPIESRKKLHGMVLSMQKKRPDASILKIDQESWREGIMDELLGGQGLFHNKMIVQMDGLLKNKEIKETIVDNLKEMKESENVFIFIEEELDKITLGKFEKKAEKVQEFEPDVPKETEGKFKIFSLTKALGRRDKKQLWILYSQAKRAGVSDEEIHGILFWQIKAMLLASKTKSAKEAGLNPFVYSKSSGFLKNFSENEVQKISSDLVTIYHEARRGRYELFSALEKFVLSI